MEEGWTSYERGVLCSEGGRKNKKNFATIQRKLLGQSIWRKQLLYLTFQYMPMYVLRVCLYVFLITVDRLVLCIPSVLCFLLECFHLGVYALTGIFLFVTERNTEY